MTKEAFKELVDQLQKGNNQALKVLNEYQEYCIKTVQIKSKNTCSSEEAYDIFIDAVLDVRRNILKRKVTFISMKAYLAKICWNKWLEKSRHIQRKRKFQEKIYNSTSPKTYLEESPEEKLIKSEQQTEKQRQQERQLELISRAMLKLSDKCQQVLKLAIVDQMPMKLIAKALNFANANVAKTTKLRCYNRLVGIIREMNY